MLLLIMLLNTTTFPYFRTTKKSLTGLLLVASSTSWLRVCFESAMCLLALGPKQTAIKHIAKRYPKSFSTNPISTRVFSQKTRLEKFRIKIAECRDQLCRLPSMFTIFFTSVTFISSETHFIKQRY